MAFDSTVQRDGGSTEKNLRTAYGIYFVKGAFERLRAPLAIKERIKNENRLNNGVQLFLASKTTKYKSREVSLPFVATNKANIEQFLNWLTPNTDSAGSALIHFKIPAIGKVFKLVYLDCTDYKEYKNGYITFTVKFCEPNPADRTNISQESGNGGNSGNNSGNGSNSGSEDSPPENPDTDEA